MSSSLLLKPSSSHGRIHHVTPESAQWSYVGLEVHRLAPGDVIEAATGDREVCLVIVSGKARISLAEDGYGEVGKRMSPFEGAPFAAYVPYRSTWRAQATTDCEIAVCSAPGGGSYQPRLIHSDMVQIEKRGVGTNVRYAANILPSSEPAHSLLVVEIVTPPGHWSSYPPHKHDVDALPHESLLEETYYHRIHPSQGYALQRVYTDDRSLNEVLVPEDRDVVLVPRGYHPVGAPHGYTLYYLNVMAGPKRIWRFRDDPAHTWARR